MKLALRFQKTDGSEVDICLDQINRVVHSGSGGNGTHTIELVSGISHTVDLKKSIDSGIPIIDTDPTRQFQTADGETLEIPESDISSIQPNHHGDGGRILTTAKTQTQIAIAPA